MKRYWRKEGSHNAFSDKVLTVEHRTMHFTKANASMPFTVVNTRNWVVTVPVTETGDLVLVRQYRIAVDEVTLEFPGGALEAGEEYTIGGTRELTEETGFIAGEARLLAEVSPNPALMSNACGVVLATGCRPDGALNPDLFEDVEVVTVSQQEFTEMVARGEIRHSIVLAAWALYLANK